MSLEFELRNVHDAAEEVLKRIDNARDRNTNSIDDQFYYELGLATGTASRLLVMLGDMAERHVYNKEKADG